MATRLYFSSAQAAAVTPTFAGWSVTTEAVRRKLLAAKDAAESLALGTQIGPYAPPKTDLDRQYVSDGMVSGISFSGTTVKMQLATRELNNGDNTTSQLYVAIVSNDGNTVRQVLLTLGQYGPNTEYINNATLRNKTFADGDTVAGTYTTVAGDRLVVECGITDIGGASPEGTARYGAPSGTADHGENETETTSLVPWIEFSNTITFETPAVTHEGAAVLIGQGSMIATGAMVFAGAASLIGQGFLTAAGGLILTGAVAMIGAAELVAVGAVVSGGAEVRTTLKRLRTTRGTR